MAPHFIQELQNWWDQIDNSTPWQDGLYYALCAACGLVGAAALIQLIRIQIRVPEYGWTTQKVFHLLNFTVFAARAMVFGFHSRVFSLSAMIVKVVLLDLPGVLYFSTYSLLVLFWAEIYHQARGIPTNRLRPRFLIMHALVYTIQASIWIYEWLSPNDVISTIAKLFFAIISFIAALGFSVYGGKLFLVLGRFPIESKGRQKKLREVGSITAICFSSFLIRTVVVAWSAFDSAANVDALNHPILNFFYYMIVEIIPSALVLYILRKLPPKRLTGYHPIR